MTGVPYYYNNALQQAARAYSPVIPVNMPVSSQPANYYYNNQQTYPWNSDINAVMRSQVLPAISRGQGYTELTPFKVPVLNTPGRLYQLDNGQAVAIIPKKSPATIKTFVNVGSFNEQKHRGISHFIEHSLFNGSEGLAPNEFVEKVTEMGGSYNASTDTADTDYYIKSPLHDPKDLDKYLEMHSNMLMYPSFTPQMIEKERGPVISEIQMYQDDTYDKAYNALIKNLFGIKTDYQGLIAGSSEIIQNLTRQDVTDYYNEWYSPDNMLTVIVGDVDPDSAIKKVSSLFNRKPSAPGQVNKQHYYEPLNLTQKTIRQDIESSHLDAGIVAIGFAGPQNNNIKDTFASLGLLTALTGHKNARLTQALKPYNSEPGGDLAVLRSDFNSPQLLQISANFNPEHIEQGLKTTYATLHDMAYRPLTPQEMFIVKNKMKDSIASNSESSMSIADMVGKAVVGHGDIRAYADVEQHIENLTPQDIQNAAQKYLNLNRASIVVMKPQKNPEQKNVSFGSNSDQFKFSNIREYSLPNNMRVIMNDDPWATKTTANIEFRTDNPATLKPGVADILSLMMQKGTRHYTEEQINQLTDVYSIEVSTGADSKALGISASAPKEKLPFAIKVMKEIMYNPDFSQEKFNQAKEEIKLAYSSVPKNPADRALETLYPDHQAGITPRKILESIDQTTLADVKNLYMHLINNSQGTAVIDGPISKTPGLGSNVFMELQSGIGAAKPYHISPQEQSKPLDKNLVIAEAEDRDQTDIVQMFKIKRSGNIKDQAALVLLNEILGGNSNSRLFSDLREKQKLAYRVNSTYHSAGDYSNLTLGIKTTTEDDLKGAKYDNLKKSLDGFRKHLDSLITTPVSAKELETAKQQVKKSISDNKEFSSLRASMLQAGADSHYGGQYYNKLVDAIETANPTDVQNTARLYLTQPSVTSIIASPDTIKNMKPYLESLGENVVYY